MNSIRRKYRILIIFSLLALALAVSSVYNIAIKKAVKIYQENARDSIVETKKIFLKDTVDNVILDIERKQDEVVEYYNHLAEDLKNIFGSNNSSSQDVFLNFSIQLFEEDEDFSVFIIESQTGKILYSSANITDDDNILSVEEIQTINNITPVFSQFEYGECSVIFYVTKDIIDEQVKAQVHDEIHGYRFSNDSYIWVNEVIDYNGGDNYAIRRIHPNLKDTEGIYLSTNMTDIVGNHPYLTELEGVKQDNEIFFNYYFKKKNSDVISEKVTYAKLYKDYDWIIAMGVHLDDVKTYVDQTTIRSERKTRDLMIAVAAITVFLTFAALVLISLVEKWYYRNVSKELNDKIYRDHLTNAYNRRAAESYLKSVFSKYKITGQNAAIIMFDVDDFKKINDECGHDKGDFVIKQVVEILNGHIRNTDLLCRWGGDEFLLICDGIKEADIITFTDKLLRVVSKFEFVCSEDEKKRNITISMGVSSFINTDTDFSRAVIRADKALYRSKSQGKNRVNNEWEETN